MSAGVVLGVVIAVVGIWTLCRSGAEADRALDRMARAGMLTIEPPIEPPAAPPPTRAQQRHWHLSCALSELRHALQYVDGVDDVLGIHEARDRVEQLVHRSWCQLERQAVETRS